MSGWDLAWSPVCECVYEWVNSEALYTIQSIYSLFNASTVFMNRAKVVLAAAEPPRLWFNKLIQRIVMQIDLIKCHAK